MSETPGLLPSIGPNTKVKSDFRTLITVFGFLLSAACWGTVVYLDVQTLKETVKNLKDHEQETAVKIENMSKTVDKICWILDPPISRPVISQGKPRPGMTP